jgi:hypothetical protein
LRTIQCKIKQKYGFAFQNRVLPRDRVLEREYCTKYGHKFQEYEETVKIGDDVTKPILKHKKQKRYTAEDLKDKLGDKLTMLSLIVDLTNACFVAKDLIQKVQAHNYY